MKHFTYYYMGWIYFLHNQLLIFALLDCSGCINQVIVNTVSNSKYKIAFSLHALDDTCKIQIKQLFIGIVWNASFECSSGFDLTHSPLCPPHGQLYFFTFHLTILYFFIDYIDDVSFVKDTNSSQIIHSNENIKYLSLYTLY